MTWIARKMLNAAADTETLNIEDFFISKEAYTSREFAQLEAERLWPRVWQVACREEELPHIGSFVTYDIVDDSIIVVRTAKDRIQAFHNVCMHRGRRLTEGCGSTTQFMCRFHGWKWALDGSNTEVVDRADWGGALNDESISLRSVKAETWGGFVFINMDPDSEPLLRFLGPVDEHCRRFEFEKLRYRWYKTVVFPCNWKVALEAFNEAYHVQSTHRQFLEWMEDYTVSAPYGPHSAFWYPALADGRTRFAPSSRLDKPADQDLRKYLLSYYKEMHEELGAMVTPRAYEAVQRVMTEVPPDATGIEILTKAREFVRQAAEAEGAGWPDITPEYIVQSKQDWHVFPNLIYLHSNVDGIIAYRSRPNGGDPDGCIFDVWSLVRYAPGAEPPLKREFYEDYRKLDAGRVLRQDFANMADVQRGLKSRAFPGSRLNPVQEQPVANFHRTIRAFLSRS
jgi:nitrite reductase/ring-hydroxylating ferredoxin subunit